MADYVVGRASIIDVATARSLVAIIQASPVASAALIPSADGRLGIDVDTLGATAPATLTHVYNVVRNRCQALDEPA